jgi:amidase
MTRVLPLLFLPVLALAADVTGTWHLVLVRFGEESADARVEFKTEGTKLTGTLNELKLEGTAENDTINSPRSGRMASRSQSWTAA